MTDELHVLVYGGSEDGACDVYRLEMYRQALASRGVTVRRFSEASIATPKYSGDSADEVLASGEAVLDREQLDWADVVLFRRFYQTAWWRCPDCPTTATSEETAKVHNGRSGHTMLPPDPLLRPLFETLVGRPDALRGRAMLYETDDNLFSIPPWNSGPYLWMSRERDLVERLIGHADLVTVSTPVLASVYRPYNNCIRVIRNAIDPSWYPARPKENTLPGDPRLVYYGSPSRVHEYQVCREAVDETRRRFQKSRRIWLGATGAPAVLGSLDDTLACVDEGLPYVKRVHDFGAALVVAQPDIGLAPLTDEEFDRCRSELHWLEYSMAGAATVASRTMGGGPYDVIRPGVDGLLVRSKADWREALMQLAASRDLRQELAGRARERVLAEYNVETRADEWADAYRWAAEHAGRGAPGRQFALGSPEMAGLEREARLGLTHRQRRRAEAEAAPQKLEELRGEREVCWSPEDADRSTVSIVVPVVESSAALVERALRSALAQDYGEIEVVVAAAADRTPSALINRLNDPRVRLVEVPTPLDLPVQPAWRRSALEAAALQAATEAARGSWIAPLRPEAELTPDHVSLLLETAVENKLEFIYGRVTVALDGQEEFELGFWPPIAQAVLTVGSELYATRLLEVAGYDPEAWRELAPAPWAQWASFVRAEVRMANVEVVVARVASLAASSAEQNSAAVAN